MNDWKKQFSEKARKLIQRIYDEDSYQVDDIKDPETDESKFVFEIMIYPLILLIGLNAL